MATEIDICNLALAHLGDDATIASIKPPEGSAQAEHAARYYPIARNSLLESHTWNFAAKRASQQFYIQRPGHPTPVTWPWRRLFARNLRDAGKPCQSS